MRLYKVEIPHYDEYSKSVQHQELYFETDHTLTKQEVVDELNKLHKLASDDDDILGSVYYDEWRGMANTVESVKEWPYVYDGMSMISTRVEVMNFGTGSMEDHSLSVERIKPTKLGEDK